MLAQMVGMADVQNLTDDYPLLNLVPRIEECAGSDATNVRFQHHPYGEQQMVINWGRMVSGIVSLNNPRRIAHAENLARLFQDGCALTLSRVFRQAGDIFGVEHVGMKASLDEWNRIFAARQGSSLALTVTISNVGRFDSYVRREIRAAVGNPGTSPKLYFDLVSRDGAAEDITMTPSLPVEARTARTYKFHASSDSDLDALYGAFQSRLNHYIVVGAFPSLGDPNDVVRAPETPFSGEARERVRREIDGVLDF